MSLLMLFTDTGTAPAASTAVQHVGRQMGIQGGVGGIVSWLKVVKPVGG